MARTISLNPGQRLSTAKKRKRGNHDLERPEQYEVMDLSQPDECNVVLWNDKKTSNATLHWSHKLLHVHKHVLSLYSTTFHAALVQGKNKLEVAAERWDVVEAVLRHMYGQSYWLPNTEANEDPMFHIQIFHLGTELGVPTVCVQAMDQIRQLFPAQWEAELWIGAVRFAFEADASRDPDSHLRKLLGRLCYDHLIVLKKFHRFKVLLRDPRCAMLAALIVEHTAEQMSKAQEHNEVSDMVLCPTPTCKTHSWKDHVIGSMLEDLSRDNKCNSRGRLAKAIQPLNEKKIVVRLPPKDCP